MLIKKILTGDKRTTLKISNHLVDSSCVGERRRNKIVPLEFANVRFYVELIHRQIPAFDLAKKGNK